ncbi:ArnT family glycosyltransferase [Streptomyces anandii]|uniref:ArnT family glycosyltransferase n=1 Tax=Streptomyces anandii TaxID=285454 RepID=UPI001675471F|nr:glycosyltransferase family 39 protein [Streptomyces anandii]
MATTVLEPNAPAGASRRAPWKSPAGQPGYARPALLAVTALAAVLYTWGIGHSQYHTFYANAVRSMTESWKAFFYGSFDPGNSITLDKLPGFLWPQAISARLLGFHPWALTLPQVLEGVASLLVLHRVVRRWAGVPAALIACTAFALTPVAVGLFRTAVEDPAFTLCLLLAAEATQRAARDGRLRPLLFAGAWVGLGFQAKMLEAWAVLPALALVYLVSAPLTARRRLAHLALAALVTTAVSASWILAVSLTPARDRPYVDGTTDNSAFSMVVGYNFLNRFSSLGVSAASTGSVSATQGGGGKNGGGSRASRTGRLAGAEARGTQALGAGTPGAGGAAPGGAVGRGGGGAGQDGWGKMFGTSLAPQTGWLYPFAAVAVVCGLLWRRGRPRTDLPRSGFLLWGTWLVTYFLVFSAGSVGGHTYYMGVIAVPLAALTGGGAALMWRACRAGGPRAWALPAAVAATAAWSAYLASRFPDFLPWLAPAVGLLGLGAVVLLVLARPGSAARPGRLAPAAAAVALAAVLIAPSAWAAQVFNPAYGSSGMGAVGPSGRGRSHGGVMAASAARTGRAVWGRATGRDGSGALGRPGAPAGSGGPGRFGGFGGSRGFRGMGGIGTDGGLTTVQRKLLAYTTAHRGSAAYVFATSGWNSASPYILATGAHVLPLGGFSGRVPFPTPAGFRHLVDSGELRYVLLGGGRDTGGPSGGFGGSGSGSGSTTSAARIAGWVRSSCAPVPASAYGAADGTATDEVLYRCGPGR